MAAKDKRPINLDISTIRLPIAAWDSITHRISGVLLFAGIGVLLYVFDLSLASDTGSDAGRALVRPPLDKRLVWISLSALVYRMEAGIEHLLLDAGIGEAVEGGPIAARLAIGISLVLIILLGVWLW